VSRERQGEGADDTRRDLSSRAAQRRDVLASLAAGLAAGADPESMRATIADFKGVPHRIEFVAEVDGVKFL
jgi:UDP-N-acetylmuramoylalanine--D-glutamate ligase